VHLSGSLDDESQENYLLFHRKTRVPETRAQHLQIASIATMIRLLSPYTLFGILVAAVLLACWLRSRTANEQRTKQAKGFPIQNDSKESVVSSIPWKPSSFVLPQPTPYPEWSFADTKPLPYRPFRYGPKHHVTMGIRNVKHEDWIELDNHYAWYHEERNRRLEARGKECYGTAPEAFPAAIELLEHLTDYLPARYPSMFRRTTVGIDNLWSGEHFNTIERALKEDPIVMSARLIQDDLAIMVKREDGQYYLLSAFIALAGFWRLRDKFGMSLSEIHTSGKVPQFNERLEKGMLSMFNRLKPEQMVARNNYYVQVDDGLAWSKSIAPEDADAFNWGTADRNNDPSTYYFRSERQTLWRMPKTGAVAFTIRTYFLPLKEIVEEDYVPGRLASAVRSWGEDNAKYKGREIYEDVLLEWLDEKHRQQVEHGLDLSKEDEVRSYPY